MTTEQLEELLADESGRRVLKHISPSLARKVIAAEKLVDILDALLSDLTGSKDVVDLSPADAALTAYREASK